MPGLEDGLEDGLEPSLEGGTEGDTSTPTPGGNTSSGILLVRGPLKLYALGADNDNFLDCYIGDEFSFDAWLMTDDGNLIPAEGTLTSRISLVTGTGVGDPVGTDASVTVVYAAGLVRVQVPAEATATKGRRQVTILRDNGAGDRQTFGPVFVRVSPR